MADQFLIEKNTKKGMILNLRKEKETRCYNAIQYSINRRRVGRKDERKKKFERPCICVGFQRKLATFERRIRIESLTGENRDFRRPVGSQFRVDSRWWDKDGRGGSVYEADRRLISMEMSRDPWHTVESCQEPAHLIEKPFRRSWFNRIARVYCHYRSHLGAITRLTIITADPARIRGRL